jgi:acyl-CoA reductase-like NAD-dependent aldehyde dehydrogenase
MLFSCPCEEVIYRVPIIFDINVLFSVRWLAHLSVILPFNWPPLHTGGKLASNLAAGNTITLTPGEEAPSTVLRICEVLEAVLPKGVIQVVLDMSTEVLQVLTTHPQVKMVSIAGSTP